MPPFHNGDTSRVTTGSLTHNERIERLWRDVHRSVTITYAETFQQLENEGVLDPLNEVDLYCLHFIYMPRICKQLSEFQESWNMHCLSTKGSKTLYQLFFEGMNCYSTNLSPGVASNTTNSSDQIDLESNDPVQVPANAFTPCAILISLLLSINPLFDSNDCGKSMFKHVIDLCGQHLHNGCSQVNANKH